MANPVVFNWPAPDTAAVSVLQGVTAPAAFILNGTLVNPNQRSSGASTIYFGNVARTVSITSTDDMSEVNFTITGLYLGNSQTCTIAGPGARETVYSQDSGNNDVFYDTVLSIVPDDDATNTSIGSGTTGHTYWFLSNYQSTFADLSVQVVVDGTITYSFETTLDDVSVNSNPTVFDAISAMSDATGSALESYAAAARYSRISISEASEGDSTGSLTATFLQQGVK